MEEYLKAWNSNDPKDIGQLFSDDAAYLTGPFDEPWTGREEIIRSWLERKDEPGSFRFRYQILAASDDTAVVRGWTEYFEPDREYSNIWVIKLNDQKQCTEFTEWWIRRRK
jgi:uncharacterized protein (TIGR02246 family)